MQYEIKSQYDLDMGALLTVRFPEQEVDQKALYTIQNEMPLFLVPFTYRSVDGLMECTYQVGRLIKFRHLFGSCNIQNYVRRWNLILQPLIECRDWFLNPFSFVLDSSELYTDREESSVKYLYIPSKSEAGNYDTLKEMVIDISRQSTVTDPALENLVLKTIMNEFAPRSFLQTLSSYAASGSSGGRDRAPLEQYPAANVQMMTEEIRRPVVAGTPQAEAVRPEKQANSDIGRNPVRQPVNAPGDVYTEPIRDFGGEIQIDLTGSSKGESKKKKEKKQKKQEKKQGGLFGLAKSKTVEVSRVYGAVTDQKEINPPKMSGSVPLDEDYDDGKTVVATPDSDGVPALVYMGDKPGIPSRIAVVMNEYGRFSIGRYDINVGSKQSDFEFEKGTKGVSRHHAVIEVQGGNYTITDLQSKAGTYVDGNRLGAGEACILKGGSRVSFGYDGADYVWRF